MERPKDRRIDAREEHAINAIDVCDLCDRSLQRFAVDAIDAANKMTKQKIVTPLRPPENYFPIQIASEGNRLVSNFEIEIRSKEYLRRSSLARWTETSKRIVGARMKVDELS